MGAPHLYPFICWWILGSFHVLAVVDSAAMNIGAHVSVEIVLSWYTPKSRIAESYANSVFSFLRNVRTVLHSGCTSLHSCEQCGAGGLVTKSCPTPVAPWTAAHQVPGILQARTLEWVAISFSNAWKWSRSAMYDSSKSHGLRPTGLLRPWDFPGKSPGVGCHCLLCVLV